MAEILKNDELKNEYGFSSSEMRELLNLMPGESTVYGLGKNNKKAPGKEVVFIRVTNFHFATMSVYEFNGVD